MSVSVIASTKLVPYSDSEEEFESEDEIPPSVIKKKFITSGANLVASQKQEGHIEQRCLSRKRQRNPENWKSAIRKRAHDSGQEYISVRNKTVPAKVVKTTKNCYRCKYKCQILITPGERQEIYENFYQLTEKEKTLYMISTTDKIEVKRHRTQVERTRRNATYLYFLKIGNTRIQVCKKFYLGTLSISERKVFTAHLKKQTISNIPIASLQGKHRKKHIPENDLELIKLHIRSFPNVESHYCRATTQRKFLESSLNITKMYKLYTEFCRDHGRTPVKESFYRHIFSTNFNLSFLTRRKDRCDICEEVEMLEKNKTSNQEIEEKYLRHLQEKVYARDERNQDRNNAEKVVLTFDLEKVLSCPKAEVSNFYYKSKFNVYNLTAHLSISKQVYCAVWDESLMGRSGNDIASALFKILEAVYADNPQLKNLILWSDSCVPQNKNSLMLYAISYFLYKHPGIESITMKFSTAGHSCIQEIDNVHSCIERVLSKAEYYSPVSLLSLLRNISSKKPYKVLTMAAADFFDLKSCSTCYNYKCIPFSKISTVKIVAKNIFEIQFKMSHNEKNYVQFGQWMPKVDQDYFNEKLKL